MASFVQIANSLPLIDSDINSLIMDYLVNEGYPAAARKFALEANIQPAEDLESVQERVEIRNAIHSGDIQTAIESINELDPQVSHPLPFFGRLYLYILL